MACFGIVTIFFKEHTGINPGTVQITESPIAGELFKRVSAADMPDESIQISCQTISPRRYRC